MRIERILSSDGIVASCTFWMSCLRSKFSRGHDLFFCNLYFVFCFLFFVFLFFVFLFF